jgi:nickel-dependent lactate racemase
LSTALYFSGEKEITPVDIQEALQANLQDYGTIRKALILPPDITRANSYAGPVVKELYEMLSGAEVDILPALGTHFAMTEEEMDAMYPGIPHERFIVHNWREGVEKIGEVPAELVKEVSEGLMDEPIDIEVNKLLLDDSYDLIVSVGQVVPHEVVGMANYSKNVFVGCGGSSMLNKTHYLGALYGMERMMGRDATPVRSVFDYAQGILDKRLKKPVLYVLSVTSKGEKGLHVDGLFVGTQRDSFEQAVKLSQEKNLVFLDEPLKKVVCYLDPEEFKSTWLGNKGVYRTRMAIADGGELIIIGPAVHHFGEDTQNDILIRKYGYFGRDQVLEWVGDPANEDLRENLSVAAHLIHGSSDGRFSITYAAGKMSKEEIEGAGFQYMTVQEALQQYDIHTLQDGINMVDGEEVFYVSNPALGLWAYRDRFFGPQE